MLSILQLLVGLGFWRFHRTVGLGLASDRLRIGLESVRKFPGSFWIGFCWLGSPGDRYRCLDRGGTVDYLFNVGTCGNMYCVGNALPTWRICHFGSSIALGLLNPL